MNARIITPDELAQGTPEWLDWRRDKIGGSDVAAILGWSPYSTARDVWASKLHGTEATHNDAMSRGTYLEPSILAWYADTVGPIYPGVLAVRDGWKAGSTDALNGRIIVEAKSSQTDKKIRELYPDDPARHWGDPGTDQVPAYYLAQAIWYMHVLDAPECHVARCAVGFDLEWSYYVVRRDLEVEAAIVAQVEAWRAAYLLTGEPPPESGPSGGAWTSYVEQKTARVERAPTLEADDELTALITEHAELGAEAKRISKRRSVLRDLIVDAAHEYERVDAGNASAHIQLVAKRASLDRRGLNRDHPGLLAKYTTRPVGKDVRVVTKIAKE